MTPYVAVLSIHVVVAVLGLGQIAGLLVVASTAAVDDGPPPWSSLRRLTTGIQISLILMLATGLAMERLGHGFYHDFWWFRASLVLWLVLGALTGRLRRALRKPPAERPGIGGVRAGAWTMVVVVAAITIMMEAKPW